MIKKQISKLSDAYHAILAKQGKDVVYQQMRQAASDFMINTNNQLQSNLNQLSNEESSELGKMIIGYTHTIDVLDDINSNQYNTTEIAKALQQMAYSYNYYENEFLYQLERGTKEERENYINTILLPLMMLRDYLMNEYNSSLK